jgi:hypothetical protein
VKQLKFTALVSGVLAACVPAGNADPQDAGRPAVVATQSPATSVTAATAPPPADILRNTFEDNFERPGAPPGSSAFAPVPAPTLSGGAAAALSGAAGPVVSTGAAPGLSGAAPTPPAAPMAAWDPGPDWMVTKPGVWRIDAGRLCGENAENHGIWLKRTLPVNARIEFDVTTNTNEGDIKAEYWGDGRSFATTLSYTNATSYLTIYGGWHNKFHVLARINEHGNDRQQIEVDPNSDDPREKPAIAGQIYHFKVERNDGKNVKWWVDGNEMLTYADAAPLSGTGHDHFGFNDWHVKVCFDNVRVVPLP